jgi:hypothetical protein
MLIRGPPYPAIVRAPVAASVFLTLRHGCIAAPHRIPSQKAERASYRGLNLSNDKVREQR